ncbi:hypothetical protein BJ980_000285 [Nocardioides daedukensis]|uniref:Uncharacterized protein n=1 Tax=Nocardioides daedukensis TaxID=634462 RepID=A0A7Y9RZ02_9ACTN|nr:hypothetical protein [Nocardioides daedukensis]NYG57362.1 hypothetical protein [Nocardioides daedukensis]
MPPADAVCSVHREFTASPRRLLAAVLATNPHRFRMVSARGAEIFFVFRVLARDGYRTGEEVLALITAGPQGSQLLVVHEGSTMAVPDTHVAMAMETFIGRVQFAYDHPSAGELRKRAVEIRS